MDNLDAGGKMTIKGHISFLCNLKTALPMRLPFALPGGTDTARAARARQSLTVRVSDVYGSHRTQRCRDKIHRDHTKVRAEGLLVN